MNRARGIPLSLVAACYVLALVQRPGTVVADTKVDLYVDPAGFLADVASAWTPTGQLGHVFGGQYGGYLFPMAPWFAGGDAAGVPTWLVHRLWLGTLLALAAYGVVRLMDALWPERERGAAHVAAAVLYVLNPYVAVYANRTSVALLAYAALPWLLLAIHKGLRQPKGWRWPAIFALALTCTGGGVNAATTAWILLGPALFLVYERAIGGVGRKAVFPFLLRLVPLTALANVWWVLPVLVHARFGLDFLPFTEQPGTIWQTTSITESLRLAGFWTSYIGVGFGGELRPFAGHGDVLLFHPAVVVAGLAVSGLTLLGFIWSRRWRYGPWFLLLALAGLLVMVAGFPEGTPLRRALTFTYNHVQAVQFLRTTYKAGPLLALGLAGLGGAAFAYAWGRARWIAAVPAAALVAVAAWPLTSGRAPEQQLAFDVPRHWEEAAATVDRLPPNERALVLPGQLFAYYDWGGTIDPILPSITDRPVAQRTLVPYADLRAIDLHWAIDDLVSQERALPGQLAPLVDLLGAGAVVTQADGDRSRSGEIGAVEAADALARGFGEQSTNARSWGAPRTELPAAGRIRAPERVPRVRSRMEGTGGIVRVVPRSGATVLDGGGQGIAALAGFGALVPNQPLAYAADVDPEAIRRAGEVVVTDTNRRQAFVSARLRGTRGFVLPPDQDVSEDGAILDPFAAGPDAQTVARYGGVKALRAPFSPQITQFPEHRPFAAVDGDPATAWLADRALARPRHWVEVELERSRRVGHVDVLPYSDVHGRTLRIAVNDRDVAVKQGWNRIPVEGDVDRIRVRIVDVSQPASLSGGAGGLREIRIPGVRVTETLRPPVLAERALSEAGGFRGGLTYLLSRQTVDAPYREGGGPVGPFQSYRLRDRVDPERALHRTIAPPVRRAWTIDAHVTPTPTAERDVDTLTRTVGTVQAESSGPYEGIMRFRASGAFDGRRSTGWIGAWNGRARLSWRLERAARVERLQLVPVSARVRRPTRVRINGVTADVRGDGTVLLPELLLAKDFELEILQAKFPFGTPGRDRQRRAVGIAEVVGIPGARVERPDPQSPVVERCGEATVRTVAGAVPLKVRATVAEVEDRRPLTAVACGEPIELPAGEQEITTSSEPMQVDHVRLRSAGEAGAPAPSGRVVDPGESGRGRRDGVEVQVDASSWLILGESYNRGWRAECDGRDLGEPEPMQGFANGWPVERGCRSVDFAFAPNRLLPPAYLISLIACLALLAVALWPRRRRQRASEEPPPLASLAEPPEFHPQAAERPPVGAMAPTGGRSRRAALPKAVAMGIAAGVVLGFVFAIRAGVVIAPAVAFILWRGVSTTALVGTAGALFVAVPVLYLAVPVDDPGGYNTNVAVERIAAHWVGVAAVVLLLIALARALRDARRASGCAPPAGSA